MIVFLAGLIVPSSGIHRPHDNLPPNITLRSPSPYFCSSTVPFLALSPDLHFAFIISDLCLIVDCCVIGDRDMAFRLDLLAGYLLLFFFLAAQLFLEWGKEAQQMQLQRYDFFLSLFFVCLRMKDFIYDVNCYFGATLKWVSTIYGLQMLMWLFIPITDINYNPTKKYKEDIVRSSYIQYFQCTCLDIYIWCEYNTTIN